ncbi:MAG: hypothetical protein ABMA01_03660 [Chthoniobacteraceae bacterium]
MKEEILEKLETFRTDLRALKKSVTALTTKQVGRKAIQEEADRIATFWIEELRSPLEHKFKLDGPVIAEQAAAMKQLHVLSRPNNLKSSYLKTLSQALTKFDDRFILPIKQQAVEINDVFDLQKLVPNLPNPDESDYLSEAINCANAGFRRAAVVMGWCALVDRMQKKIVLLGLTKFNQASTQVKNQTSGKFKNWNKEFAVATLSELQTVFDTDLIVVLEGMGLLDSNESDRLIRVCFQYRNHSAHPGQAPIEDAHLVAFFTDVAKIALQNPKFTLT